MSQISNFTEGKIFSPLLKFSIPILMTLFLQTLYGAVDLLIVGQFGSALDVSAVSTGSQVMMTISSIIIGLTMGVTILMGQILGENKKEDACDVVGSAISIFIVLAIILSILVVVFASNISEFMHAPVEAFEGTVNYVQLCGMGIVFVISYNVLGGVFRGLGDSKTPLITVAIACVVNIIMDLILVGYFNMASSGAAIATVIAQAVSVILSLAIVKKKGLPFEFSMKNIKFHNIYTKQILKFGIPVALQDLLVNFSFLVIMIIGNSMGVVASAGIGVAEKLVGFIMLVPIAFGQAISVFTAQNYGAKKYDRAKKGLMYTISTSLLFGVIMFYLVFAHGDMLSKIFSNDAFVVMASFDYLKAYAIDCLFTAIMFSMVGYFNGLGKTTFVMMQGVFGAFCIRIPLAYLISTMDSPSLFTIGLATPTSTFVQVVLCILYFVYTSKKMNVEKSKLDFELV